ncbi:19414_t:CDS:1, partial [Gigaspora margarita]
IVFVNLEQELRLVRFIEKNFFAKENAGKKKKSVYEIGFQTICENYLICELLYILKSSVYRIIVSKLYEYITAWEKTCDLCCKIDFDEIR